MRDLLQDIRYGLRMMAKSPGFTAVALATIAIGIGANAAIFSFVDGILLRPSPYKDVDRMVRVLEKPPGGGRNWISTLNYLDWEKENTVFAYMTPQRWGMATLTGVDKPQKVPCESVGVHFFDVFKGVPVLGRAFAKGEDQAGREKVLVISHSFWVSQYASDPAIVGKVVQLDNEPYTIIGVLPPGTFDLTATKMWRPLVFAPDIMNRDFHWFPSWAILKPGVTIDEARSQMDALAIRIAHDYPKSNKGWGIAIDAFRDVLVDSDLRTSLYVLMGAVGMVLLIACANLANLNLARGIVREREVAIRAALGAGRMRLIRQFLTESLLLSLVGGALGLALAYAGLAAMKASMPGGLIPANTHVELDARVLAFVVVLSLLTGVLFGIVPALKATRTDLTNPIKQGSLAAGSGPRTKGIRGVLIVAEVALAFVLLAGAGLLIRSFLVMQKAELGIDPTNVVTAWLPVSEKIFPTATEFRLFSRRVTEAVSAVPGVRSAALTSAPPMEGWGYGMPFQIADAKLVDVANRPDCFFKMVTPSYFRTLGMRLKGGRYLEEHDTAGSTPAAVINDTMAKRFFPNANPVGKTILVEEIVYGKTKLGPEIPWEVVGVVADEKIENIGYTGDASPGMYVPNDQMPQTGIALVVRGETNATLIQKSVKEAIAGVNKDMQVDDLVSLDKIKRDSAAPERFRTLLMGVFAGIALVLASIGLYGVISYTVVQRTREIGVRTALGARPGDILGLVLGGGMLLVGVGLAAGMAGALGLAQFLASMLYNVGKYDPLTFAAVAAVLLVMAFLACLVPALRAMRVSPNVALRYE